VLAELLVLECHPEDGILKVIVQQALSLEGSAFVLALNQFNLRLLCSSRTGSPFLLHDKNGGKSVFKGRNPLREFLPLKIPSSTR